MTFLKILWILLWILCLTLILGQEHENTESLIEDEKTKIMMTKPENKYLFYPFERAFDGKVENCLCNLNNEMEQACCDIVEPSYIELNNLRSTIKNKAPNGILQNLFLYKSDIYTFLYDTEYEFDVDTIFNSDFVSSQYHKAENFRNGNNVHKLYLSYCEIIPELLYETLHTMISLNTIHLEHVRLIPYAPEKDVPSDLLNLVSKAIIPNELIILSMVDCRIQTLNIPQHDTNAKLKLDNLTELKILSLASNQLTRIDNNDFFPINGKLWLIDLSNNQIDQLPNDWVIPSSVKILNLQRNRLLTPGSNQILERIPHQFLTQLIQMQNQIEELQVDYVCITRNELKQIVEMKKQIR